ncbi:capsule biosynthesis GfcC family protein [Rheinheimera salexigens]|uniref:Capsule biosynthesis GfcC-like C-terminal domain-containing protein n=1 Tax=Rheinheimera salexigens TaxID=1628148 RepID=A0A1E7Q585_9GAMM|nr:capsule biosynthesis GfcC family protein [Rheinheimera salexigens]OEY69233.1 hypothetical protein BI198_06340 [Rheinheimera salexigens]
MISKILKNIKKVFISYFLLSSGLTVQANEINEFVAVQINQKSYQYSFANKSLAPRLTDVLSPVALTENWYWPVSALYNTDDTTAQLLLQRVLQQLDELQQEYAADIDKQQAIISMVSQIKSWQLATRVFIPIEYDLARVSAEFNPKFMPGNYQLRLYKRPSHITLFGLVKQPGKSTHINAGNVKQYLTEFSSLAAADSNTLYLIQPDGSIIKETVAAWQQTTIEAMPGAQLFVPFKLGLFSTRWQRLNQDILALARHRVLL